MIRLILSIILLIFGVLILLFFRNYNGTIIPYPTLIWVGGIACILISLMLLLSSASSDIKQMEYDRSKIIGNLKTNGEKIEVKFANCQIKENNYYEEHEKYSSSTQWGRSIQTLNAITDETQNTDTIHINQCVIVYNHIKNGIPEIYYSPLIDKDKITLAFKLNAQKETTIYVDKTNNSIFYFDLEFLDN